MTQSDVLLVAVFGATGAGKTTFINNASGSALRVGHDVTSCTQEVELAKPYEQDGKVVLLIDTPGFDDTNLSDAEILKRISGFLKDSYEEGRMLSGIVFLHRITDPRVGGTAAKNLRMFRKLCGQDTLQNLTFVTNLWSTPPAADEIRREGQLKDNADFFGGAIKQGASVARYSSGGTEAQARAIIAPMLIKEAAPMSIQVELVDQGLELDQTSAGRTVGVDMAKVMAEHQAEMIALRKEFQEANEKDRVEIQAEREALEQKLSAMEQQLDLLKRPIDSDRTSWKGVIREIGKGVADWVIDAVGSLNSLFGR